MDVYILDDLLRREAVVDRFESLVWTERFVGFGDFELLIHSTLQSRSLLQKGTLISILDSNRIMEIETVENADDSEGRSMLKILGRSLEAVFEDRQYYKPSTTGAAVTLETTITDKPADIVRTIFNTACVADTNYPQDQITFYTPGNLYPANTIPEPEEIMPYVVPKKNLYEIFKEVLEPNGLGFRLVQARDQAQLYFNVYSGNDRTTSQTTLAPVVFAPDLDNLKNVTELSSIKMLKNVAYVFAPNGSRVVYANGGEATSSGFGRNVLYVDASDIDLPAGTPLQEALEARGLIELAKYRNMSAVDGEVPQNGTYLYGVDYDLGDLVELRTDDGVTNRMRVTEQIFVSDAQGDRSYPTLTIDLFITPGSWFAWDANQVWDEATGVWDDY